MSVILNTDEINNIISDNKPNSVRRMSGIPIGNINNKINIKSPVKNLSDRKRKRNIKEMKEMYIKKINDNEINRIVNQLIKVNKNSYDLCVNALIQFPSYRNKEVIDLIKPYLKELIALMDIVSKEKNEELCDKTLSQIAMNLQYKKVKKNNFVCRYGEKGNHFYIILKGKVVFLVPKIVKCYLNESEYIHYLLKLKKNGENELLRIAMRINRQFYDVGDDFDYFISELIDDFNNNTKKKYSFITPQLYKMLLNLISEEDNNKINNENKEKEKIKEKEKDNNEIVNLEEFIERSKVNDINLNSKDRKKVNVYMYQITNYFEDGQIFGTVALESKIGKRTATAICLEDCEFGLLTKEQYMTILESIHKKSLEILFNLINSYSILGFAPKKAFENRFCHMFKCIRFKRGEKIMEENIKVNSVIVFNVGQFTITLNKSILELNELMIKLHKIRGKLMGLNENSMKKDLSNNYIGKEFEINPKFILPETMKMYQQKHNLTISIINDKLVIGLLDTVDQETHLPMFNCTCISKVCDGYGISQNSLQLINREYHCLNNTNQIFLINVEYYIKRIQLHMKEIQSKINNYNNNLKYEINNKKIKKISNINNEEGKNEMIIIENEKNENDNDIIIRRNTFEIKKKNNNEISLVQMLGKSLKNDYSTLKRQQYNIIGKYLSNDSVNNNFNDNKIYENIKTTTNEEINEDNKDKDISFISKIKKSIKQKERLLRLAQGKSQKYMAIKKAEIRSFNMARNKKIQKDKYIDITAIFNNSGSNNKRSILGSAKKKDLILDNIINNIHKQSKYERVLSSYISRQKKNNNEIIENNDEEDKSEIFNDKKEDTIENKNETKNIKENKEMKKYESKRYIGTEENQIAKPNNINNVINYPLIKPNIRQIIYDSNKNKLNHIYENRNNVITLDGLSSLGEDNNKSNRKFKRYNKLLNDNNKKLLKLKNINNNNNNNINSIKVNRNLIHSIDKLNGNLPNIYNKEKVHHIDPLVLDKFNAHYYNRKLKTLEK